MNKERQIEARKKRRKHMRKHRRLPIVPRRFKIYEQQPKHKNKKLAIIVPYRDRLEHLKTFIPRLSSYLQHFKHQIFVIHQRDQKPFNRAALFNVGFELLKDHFDYFCFHDVDLLPINSDYNFPSVPARLFMNRYNMQYNYGGVTLFSKHQYELVNGHSNIFYGWGSEDCEMTVRVNHKSRPEYRKGFYHALFHKTNSKHSNRKNNTQIFLRRKRNPKLCESDGLSELRNGNFKYKVFGYHHLDLGCKKTAVKSLLFNGNPYMIDVTMWQRKNKQK